MPALAMSFIASVVGFVPAPSSDMIRLNAVPAWDPLIPELAITASIAEVSSMLIPADFATGATNFMDSANFSMSKALVLNDLAITSVTRPVSEASNP